MTHWRNDVDKQTIRRRIKRMRERKWMTRISGSLELLFCFVFFPHHRITESKNSFLFIHFLQFGWNVCKTHTHTHIWCDIFALLHFNSLLWFRWWWWFIWFWIYWTEKRKKICLTLFLAADQSINRIRKKKKVK